MEAIAKRANVSKETLYRWWHSKTEVILDTLAERGQQTIPLPDTGTLRGDLRGFLRATVDSADPATVRLLHSIAAAAPPTRPWHIRSGTGSWQPGAPTSARYCDGPWPEARSSTTTPPWPRTSSTAPCGTA